MGRQPSSSSGLQRLKGSVTAQIGCGRGSGTVALLIVHRSCGHGDGVLALALFKPMVDLAHDFETIGLLATSRS